MDIFLLRHFESIKNTQVTFSSLDDKEQLTDKGRAQGRAVASDFKEIVNLKKFRLRKIYCANSVRAVESAELMRETLDSSMEIQAFDELLSTKSFELLGKTREEVRKSNPKFMRELSLYDAGLFSSYDFHRDINRDLKEQYERKVNECIANIVNNDEDENAKVIILHNSSITASVIHFARKLCHYPEDFYGKVIADNGKFFWLHDEKGVEEFYVANCSSDLLLKMMRGG